MKSKRLPEVRKSKMVTKGQPGSIAHQPLVGDHIEIYFEKAPHVDSLRGILSVPSEGIPAEWEQACESSWVEGCFAETTAPDGAEAEL